MQVKITVETADTAYVVEVHANDATDLVAQAATLIGQAANKTKAAMAG